MGSSPSPSPSSSPSPSPSPSPSLSHSPSGYHYFIRTQDLKEPSSLRGGWLLRFYDSAHIKDDDCLSGSLPEVLQYRV